MIYIVLTYYLKTLLSFPKRLAQISPIDTLQKTKEFSILRNPEIVWMQLYEQNFSKINLLQTLEL